MPHAARSTRARRFKQQIGGGFRQAGIIAAGALYALQHHRPRLNETHQGAQRFAQGRAQLERVTIDSATVETNIVRFQLKDLDAATFVEEAHRRGVYMLPSGPNAVRAVFYLDIAPAAAEQALAIIVEVLRALPADARVTSEPPPAVAPRNRQVYQAIIDAASARRCDLIVITSHGRRGVSAVVLGSETVKVLTHSKIPVLVYR
jgi:nucleotide-binding universal stress UspA family protein